MNSWLKLLFQPSPTKKLTLKRRFLKLESLEERQLLTASVGWELNATVCDSRKQL
ncbi:MAG: hypothetical protein PHQ75_09090 [Thermoguttaceae bacterium]|nr:hypothetical protein [Thermoguttaceae bacterium]